ncbi:hypothetical protein MMC09_006005 [Bachmanniomyces sp. S44760]|nr:hypothetical protein [Bachmanniomyces sp. S44760]
MSPSYYEVLQLPSPRSRDRKPVLQDIKDAYRRALLNHHPDKSNQSRTTQAPSIEITVDDISRAYKVLSDPVTRLKYDQKLHHDVSKSYGRTLPSGPGLETVDLDDLDYDEDGALWHRVCRCGNETGFTVTEEELGNESANSEIYIQCHGCSLWLEVVFQLAQEDQSRPR